MGSEARREWKPAGVAETDTAAVQAQRADVAKAQPAARRRRWPRWPTTSSTCGRSPGWITSGSAATSTGSTRRRPGCEDVSTFPGLFAELIRRGWSDEDLKKLARYNILRVLRANEQVAARLQKTKRPSVQTIQQLDGAVSASNAMTTAIGGEPEPLQHVALVRAVVEWRRLEAAGPGRLSWRRRREEEDAHHRVGQLAPQRPELEFLPGHVGRRAASGCPRPRPRRDGPRDAADRLLSRFSQRIQLRHRDPVGRRQESPHHEHRGIACARRAGASPRRRRVTPLSTCPRSSMSCAWSKVPRAVTRRSARAPSGPLREIDRRHLSRGRSLRRCRLVAAAAGSAATCRAARRRRRP